MEYRIGVDIGGTKTNCGIIGENGEVVGYTTVPSRGYEAADNMVNKVAESVQHLLDQHKIKLSDITHFGIGIPGTADFTNGIVRYSPNLFGKSLPLADMVEQKMNIRPLIVQDSWAGAYSEYLFGQQGQLRSFLFATIGTGIGCGIVFDGKVFAGNMGTAGEIGHTQIVDAGMDCSCGRKGCLEAYASGTGIRNQAMILYPDLLKNLPKNTETIFELAYQGNEKALKLIEDTTDYLAKGFALMINILSVNTIIISGGLCVHQNLVIEPLKKKIKQYGYPAWSEYNSITVKAAKSGPLAPMIGAAFLTEENIILLKE